MVVGVNKALQFILQQVQEGGRNFKSMSQLFLNGSVEMLRIWISNVEVVEAMPAERSMDIG